MSHNPYNNNSNNQQPPLPPLPPGQHPQDAQYAQHAQYYGYPPAAQYAQYGYPPQYPGYGYHQHYPHMPPPPYGQPPPPYPSGQNHGKRPSPTDAAGRDPKRGRPDSGQPPLPPPGRPAFPGAGPRTWGPPGAPRGPPAFTGAGPRPRGPKGPGFDAAKRATAVALNREIAQARNPMQILNLVERCHKDFDAVNVSTCLHRVAKNAMVQDIPNILQHPGFEILRKSIPVHIEGFKAQQLANSLWAFATIGFQAVEQEVVDVISQRAMAVLNNFNPQNVANILWAYAKLEKQPPPELVDALKNRAVVQFRDFEPQNLSNFIWALANLNSAPSEELLKPYEACVIAKSSLFSAQAAKDVLWGYATLEIKPSPELVTACIQRMWVVLPESEPQHIGNFLWALAKMEHFPGEEMMQAIITKMSLEMRSFNAQNVSNVAWAMGALGYKPDIAFLKQVSKFFYDTMDQFAPQGLENVLWAFATLEFMPTRQVLDAVAQHSVAKIDQYNQQSIVLLLWAYAKLGHKPSEELLYAASARCVATLREASPQNLTNMLWALASLEYQPPAPIMKALLDSVKGLVNHPQFNSQALSNSIWSVANMLDVWEQIKDQEFLDLIGAKTLEIVSTFKAQNIANVMWAYAKMSCDPGVAVREACIKASLAGLEDFTAQNLANIVWSFATLEQDPGTELPNAVCARVLSDLSNDLDVHNGHSISSILWALETLRFDPGEHFMTTIWEYSLYKLEDFTPQALALTLQAYARLDYPPKAEQQQRFLKHMEDRIDEFDAQALGNAIWAAGILHTQNPVFWNKCLARFESIAGSNTLPNLRQFYQAYMMLEAATNGQIEGYNKPDWLMIEGKEGWIEDVKLITISMLHKDVSNCVYQLGYPHEIEYVTPDQHFSIDIVLPGLMVAIEVDGPSHFTSNTHRDLGNTVSRREMLQYRGYKVVQLRFWEWQKLKGQVEEQRKLLQGLLSAAGVPEAKDCTHELLFGGVSGRGIKVPVEVGNVVAQLADAVPDERPDAFSPVKLEMPAPKVDAPEAADQGPSARVVPTAALVQIVRGAAVVVGEGAVEGAEGGVEGAVEEEEEFVAL